MHNPYINEKIYYYENVIKNPESIIKEIDAIDSDWDSWSTKPIHDEAYKLSSYEFTDYKVVDIVSINEILKSCLSHYEEANNIKISKLTEMTINKHYPGKHMGPHTDASENNDSPSISIIISLNDNYKGGSMVFKNQNLTLKQASGSILIYPSKEPYSHEPELITEGKKICCTIFGYTYETN